MFASLNRPSINQIIGNVFPYIIGAAGGILSLFVSGFFREFFDERARRAKHKRDVARKVHKICTEASTGNFRTAPRDIEDVNSVLTDLEGVDKAMSVEMEKLVSSWQSVVLERSKGELSAEDVNFVKSQRDHAEEKRKILVAWTNRIRAGS